MKVVSLNKWRRRLSSIASAQPPSSPPFWSSQIYKKKGPPLLVRSENLHLKLAMSRLASMYKREVGCCYFSIRTSISSVVQQHLPKDPFQTGIRLDEQQQQQQVVLQRLWQLITMKSPTCPRELKRSGQVVDDGGHSRRWVHRSLVSPHWLISKWLGINAQKSSFCVNRWWI